MTSFARTASTVAPVVSGTDRPEPTPRLAVAREVPPRASTGPRCAFCHGSFDIADAPFSCPRCAAVLHDGCWREVGRCTSLGCRGPAVRLRACKDAPRPRLARRVVAAGFHALVAGLWSWVALHIFVLREVIDSHPGRFHPSFPTSVAGVVGSSVAWWWLLAGAGRRPRMGRWLELDRPLVLSGLLASLGLVVAAAV